MVIETLNLEKELARQRPSSFYMATVKIFVSCKEKWSVIITSNYCEIWPTD